MPKIFRSAELPYEEFLKRYLPERYAMRAAQRAAETKRAAPEMKRAAPKASKSKCLLSPWPFASWRELERAQEAEKRRRTLSLMKQRAGML
jgi:hypothetical protein